MRDSLNIRETTLPADVRQLDIDEIDNFYLKFHKAARYVNKKFKFYSNHTKKSEHQFEIKPYFHSVPIEKIVQRQERAVKDTRLEYRVLRVHFPQKLIIGLGSENVYETSLTLHHLYGIPYIPSSSLKGALSNMMIQYYYDCDEAKAKSDNYFKSIFGIQENRGKIIFFDSFPCHTPKLKLDVMNPHYGEYYMNGKPPTDFLNPVPVPFLTVFDTTFQILVATRNNEEIIKSENEKKPILDAVIEELEQCLKEFGIGAKTAIGYGYGNITKL